MKASRKDANDTHDFMHPFFLFPFQLVFDQFSKEVAVSDLRFFLLYWRPCLAIISKGPI